MTFLATAPAASGSGPAVGAPGAPRGLIIELVGPAAAGKTTLARALAAGLEAEGRAVRLAASARPAERDPGGARPGKLAAAAARAAKLGGLISAPRRHEAAIGARLLALIPPESRLWALRYRRYLAELERRWADARADEGIVIFDQGFQSALAALAALSARIDPAALAQARAAIPRPDLSVRLEAPRALLAQRLAARLGAQGRLERLFELDAPTTLRQLDAFAALDALPDPHRPPPLRAACTDPEALRRAVREVLNAVAVAVAAAAPRPRPGALAAEATR